MKLNKLVVFICTLVIVFIQACSNNDETKEQNNQNDAESNFNETGMPIVNESIELDIFASHSPMSAEDWNDVLVLDEYEDMTNININWEQIPMSGLEEKTNIALASNDLPDVFYGIWMGHKDVFKHGSQGSFIPLNDLIDKHAPNLKKLLDEYPSIKKGLTFPDGNIYSFPTIYSPEFKSLLVGSKPWVNQEWLEKLDMENPQTTEEFYQYLKAVKNTDLNGSGEHDEIPYGESSNNLDYLDHWLRGSFGIGNKGRLHLYVDLDPDTEELRFIPVQEGYKEMLQYMNKLFSEELIEQSTFTMEEEQYLANGTEALYGSTNFFNPVEMFGKEGEAYTSGYALEGPNGDKKYTGISHPLYSVGQFMITKDNEYPAETVRWMDYLGFSDEGVKLFYMGIEGVTYEETSEGPQLMDEITDNPDGLSETQALAQYMIAPGGGHPTKIVSEYYSGADNSELELEATEKLEPYLIDNPWPAFTFTEEENKELKTIGQDIEKYVSEMKVKFISGDASFSDWDDYINTIENMNLERYMEIQEAAHERFQDD